MIGNFFRLLFLIHLLLKSRIDLLLKEKSLYPTLLKYILLFSPYQLIKPKGDHGERLARGLEKGGPVFIKFGQLLSTRPDVLEPKIHEGLKRLQANLNPFDLHRAKQVIEEGLNASIDSLFERFSEEPIAAASIAQVYEASLRIKNEDPELVAIKVVRPGIEKIIKRDISLLKAIGRIIEKIFKKTKRLNLTALIDEYDYVINAELDMRIEASNISQTRRNFDNNSLLYVPKVYVDLTSKNLLVMEKIKGIAISDITSLKELDVDLKLLSERGVEIFLKQVFVDNFFHADMHPGNIFVNVDNPDEPSYIAVDYAIIGSLTEEELFQIGKILLALFNRNFSEIAEIMIEASWVNSDTRKVELERTIQAACEPIFDQPIEKINFGKLLMFLFQSTEKFNLSLPSSLMLLQKTLINVEGLGKQLYPELDFWKIAKSFLKEWIQERYNPLNLDTWVKENAFEWIEKSKKLPSMAEKAISQIGRLEEYNTQSESRNKKLIKEIKNNNKKHVLFYILVTGILLWSLNNI
ncbi:MAG: AarF/UbiB family protein [SAR86 cluster bacterium]|nr:AarF/UbiB family protein [SAR86 cluster bacterium]